MRQSLTTDPAPTPSALPTVAPDELAGWLGFPTGRTFQNAAPRLVKAHGFPPKLAGRPVWSRRAVLQWIDTMGGATAVAALDHDVPAIAPEFDDDDGGLTLEALYAGGRH